MTPYRDPGELIEVTLTTDGPLKGRCHTVGLTRLGFPELEILDVPLPLLHAGGILLNLVAEMILNREDPVRTGQSYMIHGGLHSTLRLLEVTPSMMTDPSLYDVPHWRVVEAPEMVGVSSDHPGRGYPQ